jgi:hypothetical protein
MGGWVALTTMPRAPTANLSEPREPNLRARSGYAAKMIVFLGLLILAACVPTAPPASSSCPSDCSSKYEAAMTVCKTTPRDPTGVDTLQACMDSAQQSYGTCQMNCTASSVD